MDGASASSTQDAAWRALLAAAEQAAARCTLHSERAAPPPAVVPVSVAGLLERTQSGHWSCAEPPGMGGRDFIELYLPLCQPVEPDQSLVIGHLGQSLDGCIATGTGDSCFVTGEENIRHLHRMRALADAVVVGAGTVASDDPRLTTRLVPGSSPVRVVLDPRRRLDTGHKVFSDESSQTLLCCAEGREQRPQGQAEVVGLPAPDGRIDLDALLAALRARGLRRLFIEGGGVTVSGFLVRGLLQRLQIAVAPLVIGNGRPGVTLPPRSALADALRPKAQIYRMGEDMLYDFDLTADAAVPGGRGGLQRVC